MSDDLTKTGHADAIRININERHEVDYWSHRLGVNVESLKAAVKLVGPMPKDVEKHFGIER